MRNLAAPGSSLAEAHMTKWMVGTLAVLSLGSAVGACTAGTNPQGYLNRAENPVGSDGHPQDNNALGNPGTNTADAGLPQVRTPPATND